MRHRLTSGTGLGNPSPSMIRNTGFVPKIVLQEAVDLFFKKWGYCDYEVKNNGILIGVEPAYQGEYLKVVFISDQKEWSYLENGVAWGSYGSGIASTRKYYRDYKKKSKFTRFIDKYCLKNANV